MREPPRRRAAVVAALAVLAGTPACADRPVSPLPVRPPVTSAAAPSAATTPAALTPAPGVSGVAAPSRATPANSPARSRPPAAPRTTRPTPPVRTTPPAACLGPVRYDLVLAETELALLKSLCFAAGGVLRIQGIGPGEVTVDREDLVSRNYEAGVVDIRFVRTGTVVVTIPQDGRAYPITVVVV
ncbi:hypothetical protein [Micromonospora sp. B006]|uniref:hypothetical protein n=1 Tax=Micromonospora sp. B006 TaxID=2201999 RepID=UPI000E30963F|nr:hypothetical protein [Micromonospora sp. B006]AXO37599.1 hypothetical protein MicB006_5337 [Micromonospora sp. B006]